MPDARERILSRLRQADPIAGEPPEQAPATENWDREERIRRFTERMRAVRAEIHRCPDADWPSLLLEIARNKGVATLLHAPDTPHGRQLASSHTSHSLELLAYDTEIETWKDQLFDRIDAAVTATRGAVAETGSLILWPDRHEPRLMSLVPPIHFALLDAGNIHSTFAEAVASENWAAGMPANALLISGPSKSADIEQTLAYGVHGPKELIVLILG